MARIVVAGAGAIGASIAYHLALRGTDDRIVLCDRSYFSTVAYQGARGFDPGKLLAESQVEFGRPDLVLFFDIDPEAGLARVAAPRGTHEPAFEELNYLEQVAEIFRSLDLDELVRIDAERDEDAVARDVMTAIDRVTGG